MAILRADLGFFRVDHPHAHTAGAWHEKKHEQELPALLHILGQDIPSVGIWRLVGNPALVSLGESLTGGLKGA